MDFHLIDLPSQSEAGKFVFQPDIPLYPETLESADLEFSGRSPTTLAAAAAAMPPPFENAQGIAPPNFLSFCDNATIHEGRFPVLPCTALSLQKTDTMEAMRETIFRMAMMQPVNVDPESVKQPKRKNVRISEDPQSVAARHRREKISQRIRTLQRMVPGGPKLDTASMLDEAVQYLKFLKKQVELLEQAESNGRIVNGGWNVSGCINYAHR